MSSAESRYRISIDTGGTFTDVVVVDDSGAVTVEKALTTPGHMFDGMRDAMVVVAGGLGLELEELLARSDSLVYGTTQSTNAIVEARTAKTAFLTTRGFPDVLVTREGGKARPHDHTVEYPAPYVPRRFTWEVSERVDSEGDVLRALDVDEAICIARELAAGAFEAVGVCFLWSIANPANERAMADVLDEHLPGVPYTLSHRLLPIVREYRRASATVIDASLKPLMRGHLLDIEAQLRSLGFAGSILVSTSAGGCMHVDELIARPIHTVKSGPAMAPVAAREYASTEQLSPNVIVCDTGGTTFDVGLVRDGDVVATRDTWLGEQWTGHILSVSSVDVRSIGAGGGSIAWIDTGGLVRVGPRSAGAVPGPACYGRGGNQPTVTDAAVVLGYIDPKTFLGGRMQLDQAAAMSVIGDLAHRLSMSALEAAYAVMLIANEHMITAVKEITVNEGIDPRENTLVGGGGAAGLNIGAIAAELGCANVLIPRTAAALSACGMQFADIVYENSASCFTRSDDFDTTAVRATLGSIDSELRRFVKTLDGLDIVDVEHSYFVDARYPFQVWELEARVPNPDVDSEEFVDTLVSTFHQAHERVRGVADLASPVEFVNWKGRAVASRRRARPASRSAMPDGPAREPRDRPAFFGGDDVVACAVHVGETLSPGDVVQGPAIIEEPTTTIVVYPGTAADVTPSGHYMLRLGANA